MLSLLLSLAALIVTTTCKADEFITIGKVRYKVPAPWSGHRLAASGDVPDQLVHIPRNFTENEATIYVTTSTRDALVKLLTRARKEGVLIFVRSGYRSANSQRRAYLRRFQKGRSFEQVAWTVAPPGYSQHQLGTAIDFCVPDGDFEQSAAYHWLQRHAQEFCFTESYPKREPNIFTKWEPWHWNHHAPDQCISTWVMTIATTLSRWPKKLYMTALQQREGTDDRATP